MRKGAFAFLFLVGVAVLLQGCGYEKRVTRSETPGGSLTSPDPARYGTLRLVWVREYRKPVGISTFPDGGKPLELAFYVVVYQSGGGPEEREIGRIELKPVRRGDFGNLNRFDSEWPAPDRLSYRTEYGYYGNLRRVLEGELEIPSLK